MNNYSKKEALIIILRNILMEKSGEKLGEMIEINSYDDNKLLIILHDFSFLNFNNFTSTTRIIQSFCLLRRINLIACDGAINCVEIDTGWLSNIGNLDLKDTIIKSLYEESKRLTPVEFCHIWAKNEPNALPFILFGPEDEKLYYKANELYIQYAPLREYLLKNGNTELAVSNALKIPEFQPLFKYFMEFDKVDHERAEIILQNVLNKMDEIKTESAIFVGKGNIPKYISEITNKKKISHIIIDPNKGDKSNGLNYNDNIDEFEKRIKEQYENYKNKSM